MKKITPSKPKRPAPATEKRGAAARTRAAPVRKPPPKRATPAAEAGPSEAAEPSARDLADSIKKARAIVESALDKKALEPMLVDLHKQGSYTDCMVLLSGRSDRHVQSVAEGVITDLAASHGIRPIGVEGLREGRWVLIDFGYIVVHVFYHPLREFYDLEGLWHEAPRVKIDVPAEARVSLDNLY